METAHRYNFGRVAKYPQSQVPSVPACRSAQRATVLTQVPYQIGQRNLHRADFLTPSIQCTGVGR